jgi:hypothetical protein
MFLNILLFDPEWKYQVQQGLQGDIWSGYMAAEVPIEEEQHYL